MKSFGGTPRGERLERIKASLRVHWGTFNLAMHAWHQPAEALLTLGPTRQVRYTVVL